jgi:hypothetical protein
MNSLPFKHPEFLKAYYSYLTATNHKHSYADAVVEVFENLDPTNLPNYPLNTFENIVKFEKQVINDLWDCISCINSEAISKRCIKDQNIPLETAVEYKRILQILKKYKK